MSAFSSTAANLQQQLATAMRSALQSRAVTWEPKILESDLAITVAFTVVDIDDDRERQESAPQLLSPALPETAIAGQPPAFISTQADERMLQQLVSDSLIEQFYLNPLLNRVARFCEDIAELRSLPTDSLTLEALNPNSNRSQLATLVLAEQQSA